MRFALITVLAVLTFSAAADEVQIQNNAPERYTVKKGDTLWGISEHFLKNPWKWPEVWQLNRDEIKNPHLIYPGDVVYLSWVDGKPRLGRLETVKLSPQVRAEAIPPKDKAIPAIPHEAIAQFLNQGGLVSPNELASAPTILGSNDRRVIFGAGDRVYANANDSSVPRWEIVRVGKPVKDPDNGEPLGNQLEHLGMARMIQPGDPSQFLIERANQEVVERDRLQPRFAEAVMEYPPHAPEQAVEAKVAAILGGMEGAGNYMTVLLNKGRNAGLEVGHVLGVYQSGRKLADPKCQRTEKLAFLAGAANPSSADCQAVAKDGVLPDTRVGLVFVYRVFERAAYALVTRSEGPVYVKDLVKNP